MDRLRVRVGGGLGGSDRGSERPNGRIKMTDPAVKMELAKSPARTFSRKPILIPQWK